MEVVLGKFKQKRVKCGLNGCSHPGQRIFRVPEEKRTDVNIAVRMLDDAYQDRCDNLILVSGDSDLVPAVATVRQRFTEKIVTVYVPARNPTRGSAIELRTSANVSRDLPLILLPKAQFPPRVLGADGITTVLKPADW